MVNEASFRTEAQNLGFPEPIVVPREACILNDTHTHDFTAFILVLDGEYTVTTAAGATVYGPGDAYTLVPGTAHSEVAGPAGASLLIARK
ncbi:MAG: putative cupin superfamily protein [Gammaproteobacteria bacterium]|jgi:uncharacterized cupin superfamily protein